MAQHCLLKHLVSGRMEGGVEVAGRQRKRRKQLLDDRKETRGYWKFKEEALDHTQWRTRFGRGLWACRKTEYRINEQYFSFDVLVTTLVVHIYVGYVLRCDSVQFRNNMLPPFSGEKIETLVPHCQTTNFCSPSS
jgi:hypothetical protein